MRTSTLARAGAVITASALALSLGAGPVSAAETTTVNAKAAAAPTSAPVDSSAVITTFRIGSGVITDSPTTFFPGNVQVPNFAGSAQTDVRINGVLRGRAQMGPNGVAIPRSFGSGKVQVGPTYFSDGTVDGKVSNTFYARKQVTSKATYPLRIQRRNSKVTFKVYGVKVVNPSSGQFQSVKRVKLQRQKGGKWRTVKNIKLNYKGNGTYKITNRTKYRYRLYITRSATQEKFSTVKTGKI